MNPNPQITQQQGIKINPDLCPEIVCTYCDSPTFIEVTRLKAVPVLIMPPAGGHITLKTIHCSHCRRELDLEKAKDWAHLDREGRDDARRQSREALKEKAQKSKSKPMMGGRSETMGVRTSMSNELRNKLRQRTGKEENNESRKEE
jgi:hypothetical protein